MSRRTRPAVLFCLRHARQRLSQHRRRRSLEEEFCQRIRAKGSSHARGKLSDYRALPFVDNGAIWKRKLLYSFCISKSIHEARLLPILWGLLMQYWAEWKRL